MEKDIVDRVYGCLIGGAIGDALGAPIEGMWWTDIRARYNGRLTELIPSQRNNTGPNYGNAGSAPGVAGAFTDDTTMRHYMSMAIVRKGGRITPDDFAGVLLERLNPNRVWLNERIILNKLRIGMNPWDTGKGTPPTGCASMCMAPNGIINAGDPVQAYQDGFNIAFLNQDDANRDGAATLAAAVAAAFVTGMTVQGIIQTMLDRSSFPIRRGLEMTMDLAEGSSCVDEFAEKYYARMLDWLWPLPEGRWDKRRPESCSSIEIVPIVAALLHLCQGEPNACIIEGANFGRDCDTIGSILGNITGAMHGASALRPDWIETVETANAEFFKEAEGDSSATLHRMAIRLVEALKKQQDKNHQRLAQFEQLLATVPDHEVGRHEVPQGLE